MEYILIGTLVTTHGLKGEVRVRSFFSYPESVFKPNQMYYIGTKKEPVKGITHRIHKEYHMLTFGGHTKIEDVLGYIGERIYVKRNEVDLPGLVEEDYIGLEVFVDTHKIGIVKQVLQNQSQSILIIQGDRQMMVPNVDEFVKRVDFEKRQIWIQPIKGLLDEN